MNDFAPLAPVPVKVRMVKDYPLLCDGGRRAAIGDVLTLPATLARCLLDWEYAVRADD